MNPIRPEKGIGSFESPRKSLDQEGPPPDSVRILPPDFVPGEWDVICQRGKQNYDHSKYNTTTINFTKLRKAIHFSNLTALNLSLIS